MRPESEPHALRSVNGDANTPRRVPTRSRHIVYGPGDSEKLRARAQAVLPRKDWSCLPEPAARNLVHRKFRNASGLQPSLVQMAVEPVDGGLDVIRSVGGLARECRAMAPAGNREQLRGYAYPAQGTH